MSQAQLRHVPGLMTSLREGVPGTTPSPSTQHSLYGHAADGERRDGATAQLLREALRERGAADPTTVGHVLSRPSRLAKRTIDIVGASLLLAMCAPLLVLAALAVVATSRGSAFFAQERVGRGGAPFKMYKLRSMRRDSDDRQHREYVALFMRGQAPQVEGIYKIVRDPRITRAGRVLRKYSIDELPQLWNVIRGDMSLVGPRPSLPREVELYDSVARQRLVVQPGLTGLWQVSGRGRLTFAEMIALDVAYWQNWTLLTDIKILARTPRVALSGSAAA